MHHFNVQMTGLSFIGIGLGLLMAAATQPIWNAYARSHYIHIDVSLKKHYISINRKEIIKYNGAPPPESRLYSGMVGGLLVPIGV